MENNYFFFRNHRDRLRGPAKPLVNECRVTFPGIQRPGRDADHSPPSIAEVKNDWSYTSFPSVRKQTDVTFLLLHMLPS
jgi:hypothetical protein